MSTNGKIELRANKVTRSTYNHSDSYPTWLGKQLLDYALKLGRNEALRHDAIDKLVSLVPVSHDARPTPEQIATLDPTWHEQVGHDGRDWYAYLRGVQGNPEALLDAGFIITHTQQEEWNYLLDLNTLTLEISYGDRRVAIFDVADLVARNIDVDTDESLGFVENEAYNGTR